MRHSARSSSLLLALLACGGGGAREPDSTRAVTAPSASHGDAASLPSGYALTDSGAYESEVGSGTRALLRRDGMVVDTVDLAFGVYALGPDTLLFAPVRSYPRPHAPAELGAEVQEHVLVTSAGRRRLSDFLPHFRFYFSSPVLLDRALHYWGLAPTDSTGGYRLLAMRYDFAHRRVDSTALGRARLATDDRSFLAKPYAEGDSVVFAMGRTKWRVAR